MEVDILQQIKNFNKQREAEPLQLKYKAMSESPFRFFRGTCSLFYNELLKNYPFLLSPNTWICGDLHIENFGCYKGSNHLVYFDMNDFDEAILAPVLWEISRLAASVYIAADEIAFSKKEKSNLVIVLLNHYRQTLQKKKSIVLERELATGLIKKLVDKVSGRKENELIRKRTDNRTKDAKLLITDRLFPIPKTEKKELLTAFNIWFEKNYSTEFIAKDAGFRIAGTGSIGIKRYLFLAEHLKNPERKLLIDVKQAAPSSLIEYSHTPQPHWDSDAERIISIQEMMQHVSPAFLSCFKYKNDSFVAKELQLTSDKINLSQTIKQPAHIESYMADLGKLTASAQLRSSGRLKSVTADELSDFAEEKGWVIKLMEWVVSYAEQLNLDYKKFYTAWKDGYFQ